MAKTTKKPEVIDSRLEDLQKVCLAMIKSGAFKYDVPNKFMLTQEKAIRDFAETLVATLGQDPKELIEELKKTDYTLAKYLNELLKIKLGKGK